MNARTKRPGIHARNYGFFAVIFGAVVVGAAVDAGLLCAILWVLLWLGFLDAAAALRQAAVTTKWVTEFKTFVGIPHTKQMEMISGPAALRPVPRVCQRNAVSSTDGPGQAGLSRRMNAGETASRLAFSAVR